MVNVFEEKSALDSVILRKSYVGEDEIVQHLEGIEDRDELERPDDPHLDPVVRLGIRNVFCSISPMQDLSGAWKEKAREEIEKGGFPGPVWTDDSHPFALFQLEVHSVHGSQAFKIFC